MMTHDTHALWGNVPLGHFAEGIREKVLTECTREEEELVHPVLD
jgi:hypothetical protein